MITGIPYFGENNNEITNKILSSPVDKEVTANSLYDFVVDNIANPIVIIIDDKWLTWLNDIQFNYRDKACYIPYYTYNLYELADKDYKGDNKGHLILRDGVLYIRHNYSLKKFDINPNNLSLICYNLDTSEKLKVNINSWFNSEIFDLDLLYKLYINSCFSDKDFLGLHDSGYHYISRAPRGFRNREQDIRKTLGLNDYITIPDFETYYRDVRHFNYEEVITRVGLGMVDSIETYKLRQLRFESLLYCVLRNHSVPNNKQFTVEWNKLGKSKDFIKYGDGIKLIFKSYWLDEYKPIKYKTWQHKIRKGTEGNE